MEILRKNKKKILIFAVILLVAFHIASCSIGDYYAPKWEKEDISALLDKENKTEKDYEALFAQTGLGKDALDTLLKSGNKKEIFEFSEQYFGDGEYERTMLFFPVVMTDKKAIPTKIAPLQRGDVLVSLSTYTLGFRHGHAGMVLNGERGEILEHFVIGETSKKGRISSFRYYPTLAVLRYKDREIAKKASDYAEEKLLGVAYNPLSGIIKKDKSGENPVSSSQCAHLIWQAYKAVGADIDGNGGKLVLPQDFLKCTDFEIVQIYGIKP